MASNSISDIEPTPNLFWVYSKSPCVYGHAHLSQFDKSMGILPQNLIGSGLISTFVYGHYLCRGIFVQVYQ